MGLDMYLYAKRYFSSYGDESKDGDIIKDISGLRKFSEEDSSVEVGITAMYWRKANQIHRWFVDNVQGGNDDCGTYYVDDSALIDLKNICDHIIAHPGDSMKMLPPSSGFFFGSSEIDDWYMDNIVYTSKRISEILNLKKDDTMFISFYYHSSW